MTRRAILAAGTTPLSAAIIQDGMIFVSGQVGRDRATGAVAPDIRTQTRVVIENMRAVLREAGADLNDVLKCTVFLTRQEDFGAMNEVYAEMFPEPRPARSTVVVAALARSDFIVEIEAIAQVPSRAPARAGRATIARSGRASTARRRPAQAKGRAKATRRRARRG